MSKAKEIAADAEYNAAETARLKKEGWEAHRDNNGWYLVAPNKVPDGTICLGDNGKHYPTQQDAWQSLIVPDTRPKPRDYLRLAAWVVSLGALLVTPIVIYAKREAWRDKHDPGWRDRGYFPD